MSLPEHLDAAFRQFFTLQEDAVEISEDVWYARYIPGEMEDDFDLWPEDADPRCLWTLAEDGEGGEFIISGYCRVNRIAFYVTEKPNETQMPVIVKIITEENEEDE